MLPPGFSFIEGYSYERHTRFSGEWAAVRENPARGLEAPGPGSSERPRAVAFAEADGNRTRLPALAGTPVLKTGGPTRRPDASAIKDKRTGSRLVMDSLSPVQGCPEAPRVPYERHGSRVLRSG